MRTAEVIIPRAIRGTLSYSLPETIENPQKGMRVLVPLATKEVVGIIADIHDEIEPTDFKMRDVIALLDPDPIATQTQLQLWKWMADYYMCPIGEVMSAALPAKALDKHYILAEHARRRVKLPEFNGETEPLHALDDQQQHALDNLRTTDHQVNLLYGVTGSGKTEVYMHLIREALDRGEQVLYLVPEIALTTQLTDRLQRVFGNQCLVYHSRVSDAVRMETYRQLLLTDPAEKPRVIIGARSAVFLPLRQPGWIIVDEEHEQSYKQQEPAPRYHARSVAIMLAAMAGKDCRVVLGSATPSIETWHNCTIGKYGLIRMPLRYRGIEMPRIRLIDLQRQYHRKEMDGHLSDPLVQRMNEELHRGKQIILFQNRRGYAPWISCNSCGKPLTCPHCDVSMTMHKRIEMMSCHYCGTTIPIPTVCPHCGGEMKMHGLGTERLEDEVSQLFPSARILRLDLDTTRQKNNYEEIIGQFSRHECDILIGTQMVTKGLHFDDVSLVAVLNADHMLNIPDFRSYEHTYQMLDQVSGRAGRSGEQGEVLIQSFDPEHPLFQQLQQHQYETMLESQMAERQMFKYPPFYRLILLTLRSTMPSRLEIAGRVLQERLQRSFGERISALIEPSISRIDNRYIRHIRVRIEAEADFARARKICRDHIAYVEAMGECKNVEILADVDPL